MSHTSVEAGSASDPVTILARLWCLAEGNNPDDTISDAGHTVLDGLMGGLDRKAMAAILQAERDLRAAITSPAAVPESVRRLSEAATQGEINVGDVADGWRHTICAGPMWDVIGHFKREEDAEFFAEAGRRLRTLLADAPPSGRAGEEGDAPIDARVVEEALAEFQRRNGYHKPEIEELLTEFGELLLTKVAAPAPASAGAVPEGWAADEPTPEMYAAARDWSRGKYGMPIGNEAARGCWQAMLWRAPVDLCDLVAAPAAPETPTEAPARGSAEGEGLARTQREIDLEEQLREAVTFLEMDPEASKPGTDLYTWLKLTEQFFEPEPATPAEGRR